MSRAETCVCCGAIIPEGSQVCFNCRFAVEKISQYPTIAIIASIKPVWCEKIFSGEKTLEIRKSAPIKYLPCEKIVVFVYETKALYKGSGGCLFKGAGKITGRFEIRTVIKGSRTDDYNSILRGSCLKQEELIKYGCEKDLFGWKIESPVLFKKPIELSAFGLSRPPQSWCYNGYFGTDLANGKDFTAIGGKTI